MRYLGPYLKLSLIGAGGISWRVSWQGQFPGGFANWAGNTPAKGWSGRRTHIGPHSWYEELKLSIYSMPDNTLPTIVTGRDTRSFRSQFALRPCDRPRPSQITRLATKRLGEQANRKLMIMAAGAIGYEVSDDNLRGFGPSAIGRPIWNYEADIQIVTSTVK